MFGQNLAYNGCSQIVCDWLPCRVIKDARSLKNVVSVVEKIFITYSIGFQKSLDIFFVESLPPLTNPIHISFWDWYPLQHLFCMCMYAKFTTSANNRLLLISSFPLLFISTVVICGNLAVNVLSMLSEDVVLSGTELKCINIFHRTFLRANSQPCCIWIDCIPVFSDCL